MGSLAPDFAISVSSHVCFNLVLILISMILRPGHVAQSVWQHTFVSPSVSPSAFSRRAVVSYWRKSVLEVLLNRLGGLSLSRKSVVRLIDRPDMTLDVYCERKTTMQQQQQCCF